jgi:hypothetical protein
MSKAQKSIHFVAGAVNFKMWEPGLLRLWRKAIYKTMDDVKKARMENVRIRYHYQQRRDDYAYGSALPE